MNKTTAPPRCSRCGGWTYRDEPLTGLLRCKALLICGLCGHEEEEGDDRELMLLLAKVRATRHGPDRPKPGPKPPALCLAGHDLTIYRSRHGCRECRRLQVCARRGSQARRRGWCLNNLHELAVVGTIQNGRCRACHRERRKRYMRRWRAKKAAA